MAHGPEQILPYNDNGEKSEQIERMFDSIAFAYDKLNRTLSLGIDRFWRWRGIRFLKRFAPVDILDIATGTGDLAIKMARAMPACRVTGADISTQMMQIGQMKAEKAGVAGHITFERQDCLSLSYPADSFDAVTAAFGVRNFENLGVGLREMYRVLRPGGNLLILELSQPESFPMKQLYSLYSRTVIPYFGKLFSKEKAAYDYLPASIRVVPQGKEMAHLLELAGFTETRAIPMTFGICTLYIGKKK